jgi:hypothetical protein
MASCDRENPKRLKLSLTISDESTESNKKTENDLCYILQLADDIIKLILLWTYAVKDCESVPITCKRLYLLYKTIFYSSTSCLPSKGMNVVMNASIRNDTTTLSFFVQNLGIRKRKMVIVLLSNGNRLDILKYLLSKEYFSIPRDIEESLIYIRDAGHEGVQSHLMSLCESISDKNGIILMAMARNGNHILLSTILDKSLDTYDISQIDCIIRECIEIGYYDSLKVIVQHKRVDSSKISNTALFYATFKKRLDMIILLFMEAKMKLEFNMTVVIDYLKDSILSGAITNDSHFHMLKEKVSCFVERI